MLVSFEKTQQFIFYLWCARRTPINLLPRSFTIFITNQNLTIKMALYLRFLCKSRIVSVGKRHLALLTRASSSSAEDFRRGLDSHESLSSDSLRDVSSCVSIPPEIRQLTSAKSWSLKLHLTDMEARHAGAATLSDADVEKVADYAHLHLGQPGSAAFEAAKTDLTSVLAAAAYMTDYLAARSSHKRNSAGTGTPTTENALTRQTGPAAVPAPTLEQLSSARMADLRPDVPTEGGDAEALLRHAAKREGQFFVVPRAVEA